MCEQRYVNCPMLCVSGCRGWQSILQLGLCWEGWDSERRHAFLATEYPGLDHVAPTSQPWILAALRYNSATTQ